MIDAAATPDRHGQHPPQTVCPECGYTLDEKATTTRCPECGLVLETIIAHGEARVDVDPRQRQVMAMGYGLLAVATTFGFYYGFVSAHSAFLATVFGMIALLVAGGCWVAFARGTRRDVHRFWMLPDAALLHSSTGRITRLPWTDLYSAVNSEEDPDTGSFGHRLMQRSTARLDLSRPNARFCTLKFQPSWKRWWFRIPARLVVKTSADRRCEFDAKLRQVLEPKLHRS